MSPSREAFTIAGILLMILVVTAVGAFFYDNPATGFISGCFAAVTWGYFRHRETERRRREEDAVLCEVCQERTALGLSTEGHSEGPGLLICERCEE